MDKSLRLAVSPHIHSGRSTAGIMRDVLIALLPAAVAGTVIFGLRSLLVIAVCVLSCVLCEALFNVIVKKEQTVGGIIIPDAAKEKPITGTVKAIGKKYDKDHKELAFDVKVGDTVLLPKYGGTDVKLDGKKLQLVREEDLLGVLEK